MTKQPQQSVIRLGRVSRVTRSIGGTKVPEMANPLLLRD